VRAPKEAGAFKSGDVLGKRYEIRGVIGEGPVAVVYRARDREVDVQVAIKVINSKLLQAEEERDRYRKEAKIARGLSHRNIIRLYDEDFEGEHPFIVMQHLEGLTLRKIIDLRIEQGGTFTLKEIQPILAQLLDALEYAHSEKGPDRKAVAHGDLKPSNVIVLPDLLKVSDFRQAQMIPRVPFIAAQKVRGKDAAYLPPELIAGESLGAGADFFAVGVLLGEMLCGELYDPRVGLELHQRNDALPVSITSIFKRLTTLRSKDRYQRIEHLRSDFKLAVEGKAPKHVGAFRAQITNAEKLEEEMQVLHTGEFEALDSSPSDAPRAKKGRSSFGLESEASGGAGFLQNAPPIEDDDEEDQEEEEFAIGDDELLSAEDEDDDDGASISEDEILSEEEAFGDDEFEDDEYEDDSPSRRSRNFAASDEDTGEADAFPEDSRPWEGQESSRPASNKQGRDGASTQAVPLRKKRGGAQPSLEALLSEGAQGAEAPLLDDLLDAAHDLPSSEESSKLRSLQSRVQPTGPSELGAPLSLPSQAKNGPPGRAQRPVTTTATRLAKTPRRGARRVYLTPLLVGAGVLIGLVVLLFVTDQGKALIASFRGAPDPSAARMEGAGVDLEGQTDTGTPADQVELAVLDDSGSRPDGVGAEGLTGEEDRPSMTVAPPSARELEGSRASASAGKINRGGARMSARQIAAERAREAREAKLSQEAARRAAELAAREESARRVAEREAERVREEREAQAAREAKSRSAAQEAERQALIELEKRRQEAELARRNGGSTSSSGAAPFKFDAVDREMPVRSVSGGPLRPLTPKAGAGASDGSDSAPAPSRPASGGAAAAAEAQDGRCPKGMVFVGAGAFMFGSAANDPMRNFAEKSLSRVVTDSYCIDRYEYGGKKPKTKVSWFKAKELCERRNKRLCSEEEWEKSCKGPKGLRFPYGNTFDPSACNTEDGDGNDRPISSPGAFRRCRSAFGVFDLAGNVSEWTSSAFQAGAAYRTQKGGASDRPDWDTRCATRGNKKPNTKDDHLGFRCCANPN